MVRTLIGPGWTRAAPSMAMAVRRSYSSIAQGMTYDLHKPAKPRTDEKNEPILFLHGLFGAKKNNRGISK